MNTKTRKARDALVQEHRSDLRFLAAQAIQDPVKREQVLDAIMDRYCRLTVDRLDEEAAEWIEENRADLIRLISEQKTKSRLAIVGKAAPTALLAMKLLYDSVTRH